MILKTKLKYDNCIYICFFFKSQIFDQRDTEEQKNINIFVLITDILVLLMV